MAPRVLSMGLVLFLTLLPVGAAFALLPYLATETAIPVDRGRSRLEMSILHEQGRSWWTEGKHRLSLSTLTMGLTYGLINNLDYSVDIPYRFRNERGAENDEDGLGDIRLKAKIRFIKGREANPVSVAGLLTVKFPTCNRAKQLSQECTGEPDVGLRAIASKEFSPVTAHLNLGYIFIASPPDETWDDVLQYSLAVDYLTTLDYFHLVGELAGETNRDPDLKNPATAMVGVLYDVDVDKVLSLASSFGLTDASPDYGVLIGYRYLF